MQDSANKEALNSKLGSFLRISPDPAMVMNENMVIQITTCCHLGMTKTSFGRFVTVRIGGFPLSKSPIIPNFSKCLFILIRHSLSESPPIAFTLQENSPVSGSPSMKYLDEITWIKSLLLHVSTSISSLPCDGSVEVMHVARGSLILPLAFEVYTLTCS